MSRKIATVVLALGSKDEFGSIKIIFLASIPALSRPLGFFPISRLLRLLPPVFECTLSGAPYLAIQSVRNCSSSSRKRRW